MRFNRLDLNLLVALDVLLRERSITRAARHLNLSQSATSGVLARLRDFFDDDLLVASGRSLSLTPLAASLVDPLQQALQQIQATIETRPGFDPATAARTFRVLAPDYVSTVLLGEVSRRLHACAPRIALDILPAGPDPAQQVERGGLDVLILPRRFLLDGHPSMLLFEENQACVVWKGNSVVGEHLGLDQYLALGHVATRCGPVDGLDERRIEVTTSNFTSVPHFLAGTDRIAAMPLRLARLLAGHYPLRLLAPPRDLPRLAICMQWNRCLDKDPSHVWFRALLAEAAHAGADGTDGADAAALAA